MSSFCGEVLSVEEFRIFAETEETFTGFVHCCPDCEGCLHFSSPYNRHAALWTCATCGSCFHVDLATSIVRRASPVNPNGVKIV